MYRWATRGQVKRTSLISLFCLGILVGISVTLIGFITFGLSWLIIASGLLLLSFRRSGLSILFVLISGLLFGNFQASRIELQNQSLKSYIGQKLAVEGTVSEDILQGRHGDYQFRISSLHINGNQLAGSIKVSSKDAAYLKRGDAIRITGKASQGFGSDTLKMNFADIVLIQTADDPVIKIRDKFADGVRQSLNTPADSLGLGFLLGQRHEIPKELDDAMRSVGLTHIVVASGYNLTILIRASRRMLAGISKYLAFTSSMGLMAGFVMMTGFSPSMTRAALVTGLSLTAWYYGRKIHPIVLLLFAAAITALINPFYVWSDAGWYLSFLAFAGILILAPMVINKLYKLNEAPMLVQIVIETLVAQIMTLPFILWMFGDLAVLAVIANLMTVPLIPFVMLGTFVAGLVGMTVPVLGTWAGLPAQSLIEYMILIVNSLSSISWSVYQFSISLPVMLLMYVSVAVSIFILWKKSRYNFLNSQITD